MREHNSSVFIRSIVLGGVDGIITTFTIIMASLFTSSKTNVVAVVGTASLFSDGMSMAVSEYLSNSNDKNAIYMSIACFGSFVVCGGISLLVFVFGRNAYLGSGAVALFELFCLGAFRSYLRQENFLYGVAQTTLLGGTAFGVAAGVAALVGS